MRINNKTQNAFGKSADFAAIVFLLTGAMFIIAGAYIMGAVILVIASFVFFSFSGVELDTEKRAFRQYNKWFGIISTGRWKTIDPYIGITIVPMSITERTASWSNQISSTEKTEYRIFLIDQSKKPAFAIKNCDTEESAKYSLDEFSLWLKLPVYTVKRENNKTGRIV